MSTIADKQIKWLKTVKRITVAVVARANNFGCPYGRKPDQKDLRKIAELNRSIANLAEQLIELESDSLGFMALLGRTPTISEAVALALLFSARHNRDASNEVDRIADVVTLVSARNPQLAVETRCLFKSTGSLHSHVWTTYSSSLDDCEVFLTEGALNTILNQPDDETTETCAAVAEARRKNHSLNPVISCSMGHWNYRCLGSNA